MVYAQPRHYRFSPSTNQEKWTTTIRSKHRRVRANSCVTAVQRNSPRINRGEVPRVSLFCFAYYRELLLSIGTTLVDPVADDNDLVVSWPSFDNAALSGIPPSRTMKKSARAGLTKAAIASAAVSSYFMRLPSGQVIAHSNVQTCSTFQVTAAGFWIDSVVLAFQKQTRNLAEQPFSPACSVGKYASFAGNRTI